MDTNDPYAEFDREHAPEKLARAAPGFKEWSGGLITEPGAYIGIPMEIYHGAECCAGPSISSSSLAHFNAGRTQRTKGRTPAHYWHGANLNPNRKKPDTVALRMGRAFHDCLLMPGDWDSYYHITPEGFSRAAKVKMAAEIADADAAIEDGLCVLSYGKSLLIEAMAEAMRADSLVMALIKSGEPEVTLAWQDEATGVWCRTRPDFILTNRAFGLNVKTDADASYDGFSRAIGKYGYAQRAAFEMDAYKAVFGSAPETYLFPVVEKPTEGTWKPGDFIATAMYSLPPEDLERGRWLNKIALRTYAECLKTDTWPGYTPDPEPCGIPGYQRKLIDEGGQAEAADDAPEGNPWMETKE